MPSKSRSRSKSKSKTKSGGGKSPSPVGPFIPDPLPPVLPKPTGTIPTNLPFPAWLDQDINGEKWDLPKGKDKGGKSTQATPKNPAPLTPPQVKATGLDEPTQYEDPHVVNLPNSLEVQEWKRPADIFPDGKFLMYKEKLEYSDLLSGSTHILHSEFMRSFISAIGVLEYLGNTRPSPIEFTSPTFFPNTGTAPWKPWFHIYSMCKAGKGQKHKPQVNTLGKYVVRLFWLGSWRKIVIDDRLPLDKTNHVLLPCLYEIEVKEEKTAPKTAKSKSKTAKSKSTTTSASAKSKSKSKSKSESKSPITQTSSQEKSNSKRVCLEMWPFLLCKALLKIASLTWNEETELLDFDIIHSLTGWFPQKISVAGWDVMDIWEICIGYTDHYAWVEHNQKRLATGSSKSTKSKSKSSKSKKSKSQSSKSKKSKSGSKFSSKASVGILNDADLPIPHHVVATCFDLRRTTPISVTELSPCWSHTFLIDQTRVIPIIKPEPVPELAPWKRFRWLAWAISKGTCPNPYITPVQCLKLVSSFRKFTEHVVYEFPSKQAIEIKQSVAMIEEIASKMENKSKSADKKGKSKNADKKGKSTKAGKGNKSSKGSKKSKSSKSSKSSKGGVPLPPDPSFWEDFIKLGPCISDVCIYLKRSAFSTNIQITDIAPNTSVAVGTKDKPDKAKKGKEENTVFKLLIQNSEMQASRNEPLYLFMDSLDYKLLVINVAQMGDINNLKSYKSQTEANNINDNEINNHLECTYKKSLLEDSSKDLENICTCNPFTYVILEDYQWDKLKTGDMITFLNTHGTKTVLTDINPGRFILRLWVKSDTCYFINCLSDTPIMAGTLEDVLEYMCRESQQIQNICHNISSCYGQLVQNFGTSQFHESLVRFSNSYLPKYLLSAIQKTEIHDIFIKEFLDVLQEICLPQEFQERVFALRVLFLNPHIKYKNTYFQEKPNKVDTVSTNLSENEFQDVISQKKQEHAACILQAFFKRIYVRKLHSLHKQTNKNYIKIFELLKKNYTECFSVATRMKVGLDLLKNFILSNPGMKPFQDYYEVFRDLRSTIFLKHVTGTKQVLPNSWIVLTRQTFFCRSLEPVLLKICLFCGLPNYMVRVFNNDTNEEIRRIANNVITHAYKNNSFGYTVLCYGWSVTEGLYPWKLDFITIKRKEPNLILLSETTNTYTLKDNYIPNVNNLICRLLIQINKDITTTFRISVSHEKAKLHFRCTNEVGQVLYEAYGTESAIIPNITLKYSAVPAESLLNIDKESLSQKERKLVKNSKSRSGSLVREMTGSLLRKKQKSIGNASLDRYSLKSSLFLKKFRSNSTTPQIIKYKDCVYILEAFVIDNSWPLTSNEWSVVEEIKSKDLLGPPVENTTLRKSFSDVLSHRSESSAKHPKEITKQSLNSSKKLAVLSFCRNPSWCVEAISNAENDTVLISVDNRRKEKIKDIKRQWYLNEPERYDRSRNLREIYLDSHYIKDTSDTSLSPVSTGSTSTEKRISLPFVSKINSDTKYRKEAESNSIKLVSRSLPQLLEVNEEIVKDKSVKSVATLQQATDKSESFRTLSKPVSKTTILPPFDITQYYLDQLNDKCVSSNSLVEDIVIKDKHVRTAEEIDQLAFSRIRDISQFEIDQISLEEDSKKSGERQVEIYQSLEIFYKECRDYSKEIMNNAYAIRDKVLEKAIAAKLLIPPTKGASKASKKKKKT